MKTRRDITHSSFLFCIVIFEKKQQKIATQPKAPKDRQLILLSRRPSQVEQTPAPPMIPKIKARANFFRFFLQEIRRENRAKNGFREPMNPANPEETVFSAKFNAKR